MRDNMRVPDCLRHQSRGVSEGWTEEAILRAVLFPADECGVHLVASPSHCCSLADRISHKQLQSHIQMKKSTSQLFVGTGSNNNSHMNDNNDNTITIICHIIVIDIKLCVET